MKKDRFDFICQDAEAGIDAFVNNPGTREEGTVLRCSTEHLIVKTSEGKERCWDFNQVEEMHRSNEEWPYR